jgi:hypothetical protein
LTVTAGSGLVLYSAEQQRRAPTVDLSLSDSVIVTSPTASLIEVRGNPAEHPLGTGIVWRADRMFYEGLSVFFRWSRALGEPSRQMDLASWQAFWNDSSFGRESAPHLGQVKFAARASDDRRPYEMNPDDFRLDEQTADNPARSAAGDGGKVGFRRESWPADMR